MRGVKNQILEVFRKEPLTARSTTEVVEKITPGYEAIEKDILDTDREKSRNAKKLKAKLHRKTLYYLNKLVRQGFLSVKTIGENKEKVFVLTEAPTQSVASPEQRAIPAMPIEGYEQKKIIYRLEPLAWLERLNAILLETPKFCTAADLSQAVTNAFGASNDALGLNDFEQFFQKEDVSTSTAFLRSLNQKCEDYGRKATLVIDLTNVTSPDLVLAPIKNYLGTKIPHHITFVFDVYPRELIENKDFFEKLINIYAEAGESIFIKNENVHNAPYIIGKAGPYTFPNDVWKEYKSGLSEQVPGLVCAHATIMVDVEKYFRNNPKTPSSFTDLMLKVAKSLRLANENQRKKSSEFFKGKIQLTPSKAKQFFKFSRNYIRFWNYGWKVPGADQNFVLQFLQESKNAVNEYCLNEETIYQSCGMPTRFRIAYSCAFEEFVKEIFTKPLFPKCVIKTTNDYESTEVKELIRTKETIVRVFDGGDLMTFKRTGTVNPAEIISEISKILINYGLPLFRIQFSEHKTSGVITLSQFMEE
ncbi:MAG: hypothetical protein QXF14_03920 [Candidatus Woesearchaeota archaeon]